jgi:excisionase family DNA binding protein
VELLTLDDVATRLRVSRRTVERIVKEGRIRVVHVGRQTRVTPRELDAYIAALVRAA